MNVEMKKHQISSYTMKMRIYPSKEQAQKLDTMFRALHIAYNITFHEVFMKNERVCIQRERGLCPDFVKMAKKEWRAELIKRNPLVAVVPAASITTQNGLFLADAKRAWENGMHNYPIEKVNRKDFHFYNKNKPRNSLLVQVKSKNIMPSEKNLKVAWIILPKIKGKIKARGFNRKIWFGKNGTETFEDAVKNKEMADELTVRVSKDTCGDYYISITISSGKREFPIYREYKEAEQSAEIGLDVGIKDIAILNDGTKYANKHFKREKENVLRKMNRQLSRRWGPVNSSYRDYRKDVREKEKTSNEEILVEPSKKYLKTKRCKARLERKIARQRETYYHQMTAEIIERSPKMIAVETLYVKNMMRNRKLAYAWGDAAMSDFISKLKYKSERRSIPICQIGTFEASSQMCSVCGEKNPNVKNLSVRRWKCPACGEVHDRDVNAAKNILAIAIRDGEKADAKEGIDTEKKTKVRRKSEGESNKKTKQLIFKDRPEIIIKYSKELTQMNSPRYVIVNTKENKIIDDAQGSGYRSISNARNCYKAKLKWANK